MGRGGAVVRAKRRTGTPDRPVPTRTGPLQRMRGDPQPAGVPSNSYFTRSVAATPVPSMAWGCCTTRDMGRRAIWRRRDNGCNGPRTRESTKHGGS